MPHRKPICTCRQAARVAPGHKRRRGRGFTLAEVLIASVVLSLVFVALLAAFGHESLVVQRGEEITVATFLVEEIRDMALQLDFENVFSLDGVTYSPAVLSTGESQSKVQYAQSVEVTPLENSDLETPVSEQDADAALLEVTVTVRDEPVLTQCFHIFDMSGVQYQGQ